MEQSNHGREQGMALLLQYNQRDDLIRHALSVESVMRRFALILNEDVEKWGVIGLIHDLDYEQYPDLHCTMSEKLLTEAGWPREYIRAVVSHGWKICSDTKPEHIMEKVLYTIDELTGLIYATCLMRPGKSIFDLNVDSVKKKFKQKSFAANVNRSVIEEGVALLGMDLGYVILETIEGMKNVADDIGLRGAMS